MVKITCDNCGTECGDGDHWVHASVYHHDDPEFDGDWDKNNPRNFAVCLCPDCGDGVIEAAGGEPDE